MKVSKKSIEIIQLEDKAAHYEELRRSAYLLSLALEELVVETQQKLARAKKKKSKQ